MIYKVKSHVTNQMLRNQYFDDNLCRGGSMGWAHKVNPHTRVIEFVDEKHAEDRDFYKRTGGIKALIQDLIDLKYVDEITGDELRSKIYEANVKVKAIFYDGSNESLEKVLDFCRTKTESRIEMQGYHRNKKENKIFVIVKGYLGTAYVSVKKNQYIVRYPSGLFYPYGKEAFEKRFKETKEGGK